MARCLAPIMVEVIEFQGPDLAYGIFFTTVQKFGLLEGEGAHPVLCKRSNVVVISDEAHRSQYGQKGRLNTKTGEYAFGFSKYLRARRTWQDALPNASFIGYACTPTIV